jgi:hypothetical protein
MILNLAKEGHSTGSFLDKKNALEYGAYEETEARLEHSPHILSYD